MREELDLLRDGGPGRPLGRKESKEIVVDRIQVTFRISALKAEQRSLIIESNWKREIVCALWYLCME